MRHHMKQLRISILLFYFLPQVVCAQKNAGDWLTTKFLQADTIVLVSHELVVGSSDVQVDSLGNIIPFPPLIVDDRPNAAIIIEKVIINGNHRKKLISILNRPFRGLSEAQSCMRTHHAIFLIKNGRTSYINLCFECGSYEKSEDLSGIQPFDQRRWKELRRFFRDLGLKSYLGDG